MTRIKNYAQSRPWDGFKKTGGCFVSCAITNSGTVARWRADKELEKLLSALESGEAQRVMQQTFEVWARSDIPKLEQFPDWCQCVLTPQERVRMEKLNDDRNLSMARQVMQLPDSGKRLFVAVGALHMVGAKPADIAARARRCDHLCDVE